MADEWRPINKLEAEIADLRLRLAAAEARVKELEALVADREGSYEFLQEINRSHVADLERAEAELKAAREALREIAKGEGAFSRDPLTHASNAIDNMKSIAVKALKGEDK